MTAVHPRSRIPVSEQLLRPVVAVVVQELLVIMADLAAAALPVEQQPLTRARRMVAPRREVALVTLVVEVFTSNMLVAAVALAAPVSPQHLLHLVPVARAR